VVSAWQVPPLWSGRTVAILASGPSMTQAAADAVRAAGVAAIAINSTLRLAPWADMLYAADPEWWGHASNRDALAFPGLRVSCSAVRGVHQLRNSGVEGFDPDPMALRTGGNSGYQGLHIAIHGGAARVLLLGFDMRGCHWHGPHPAGFKVTTSETYARWVTRFPALGKVARARGIEIVNCTPGSALQCFPMADLAEQLETASC
jgi:hypothetical protein